MGPINNDYTNASSYSSNIQSNQTQQIPSYEQGLRDLYTQITNDIKNVPTENLLKNLKLQTNLRQPQLDRALTVKLAIYRAIEQRAKSNASGLFKVTNKQLEKAKDIIYSEPNRLVVVQGFVDGTLQSVNRNSVSTKPVTTTPSSSNIESFTPEQKEDYTQNVANSYKSYVETFRNRPADELMTVIEQAPTNERNIDTQNAAKLAAAKEIIKRFNQQAPNSIPVITESQKNKARDILQNTDSLTLQNVLDNLDKYTLQPRRPLPSLVSAVGTRPAITTSATATAKLSDEAFKSLKASLGNTTSPSNQAKALYELAKLVRTPGSMTLNQEEQLGVAAYNMTNKDAVLKEFKGYNTGLDRMGEIINAEFSMRGASAAVVSSNNTQTSSSNVAASGGDVAQLGEILGKSSSSPQQKADAYKQLLQLAADGEISRVMLDTLADKIEKDPAVRQALGPNANVLLTDLHLGNNLENAWKLLGIKPGGGSTASSVSSSSNGSSMAASPASASIAEADKPLVLSYQDQADVLEVKTDGKADIAVLKKTFADKSVDVTKRLYSYLELVNQASNGNTSVSVEYLKTEGKRILNNSPEIEQKYNELKDIRFKGIDFKFFSNITDVASVQTAGALLKAFGAASTDFARTPGARRIPKLTNNDSTSQSKVQTARRQQQPADNNDNPSDQPVTQSKPSQNSQLSGDVFKALSNDLTVYFDGSVVTGSSKEKALIGKIAHEWSELSPDQQAAASKAYAQQPNNRGELGKLITTITSRLGNENAARMNQEVKQFFAAKPGSSEEQAAAKNIVKIWNSLYSDQKATLNADYLELPNNRGPLEQVVGFAELKIKEGTARTKANYLLSLTHAFYEAKKGTQTEAATRNAVRAYLQEIDTEGIRADLEKAYNNEAQKLNRKSLAEVIKDLSYNETQGQ